MYDDFHRRGSQFLGEGTNNFKCILNLQHQEGIMRQFWVPILSDHGSWKISVGVVENSHHEHLPILYDHDHEFIVKIDDRDRVEEGTTETRGSVVKATGEFLNKQKDVGGEMTLDMDLEMDELCGGTNRRNVVINQNPESPIKGTMINNENVNPNSRAPNSKELRVSFQRPDDSSKNNNITNGNMEIRAIRIATPMTKAPARF
ncbi:hypothetical protein L6452_19358 [Arctium lappa]|uniref:Uncharacterized protein n=1 Tax=Arctium lappa TaxID=4217 RepID=A0ACB9B7N3_ARCLA|nr:hypothetical protein L6452_19358 [Arctium lappa]